MEAHSQSQSSSSDHEDAPRGARRRATRRRLFLVVGGALVAVLIAGMIFVILPGRGGPKTYTDPQGSFVLRYPAGWQLHDESGLIFGGDSNSRILGDYNHLLPLSSDFAALALRQEDQTPGTTLMQFAESERLVFMSGANPATCAPVRDAQVGGEPARLVQCTHTSSNQSRYISRTWFVYHNGMAFTMNSAEDNQPNSGVDAIVSSFMFR